MDQKYLTASRFLTRQILEDILLAETLFSLMKKEIPPICFPSSKIVCDS